MRSDKGTMVLEREIIRQRKRNLWLSAKFTILDTEFLLVQDVSAR
jgi:hypothetical protein